MSRCLTLKHTGLADGICVSATTPATHPHAVEVGSYYQLRYDTQVRRSTQVLLDRFHPPPIVDGMIKEASVIQGGEPLYLRQAFPRQSGVLVLIDTSHTEPCETGGRWEVTAGNPRVVSKGVEGLFPYEVQRGAGLFDPFANGELIERVDASASYDVGLLLLLPGDRLKVIFHAPGSVVGDLSFQRGRSLEFILTANAVDKNYEHKRPNYQEEQDMSEILTEMERDRASLRDPW